MSAEGPRGATLEEQGRNFEGAEGWETLCNLPCTTRATSAPFARHRIVDHSDKWTVKIIGKDGERVVVRFERRSNESITVMGTAAAIAGVGLGGFFTGLLLQLRNVGAGPAIDCEGSECERREAEVERRSETATTVSKAGLILLVTGAIGVMVGGVMSKTSVTVIHPPSTLERAETGRTGRQPVWTQAELPKPPLHATFIDLRF